MYLFDKNGDKVEVYSINPNLKKVIDYKNAQLNSKNKDEIMFGIETNIKEKIFLPNSNINIYGNKKPLDYMQDDISFQYDTALGGKYHRFTQDQYPKEFQTYDDYVNKLLQEYIYFQNTKKQLVRVLKYDEEGKELAAAEHYYFNKIDYVKTKKILFNKQYIPDIIALPKELYLYELLNQGHFNLINENVAEQIELFDVSTSPVKTFDLNELRDLEKMGISDNAIERANDQIEASKKVLKYVK